MSAGYADLRSDEFMIEEKSEKEPAKEEVDTTPVVPETPLVVERSTREELTFTLGEENPSVVTTTVDDSKGKKGTNGTITKFIEIEGKTREIMKANAEDTIVCINNSEHSYNIVVGNREEGGKWVHSFYKKSGDHDIFTDVTVKSLFRNIDFSEMFDDAMIMEFSQTEPLHVPKFMFNGKVNASLKQVEANSQSFVLESVTNGYVRIAQDLLFADNGAGMHSFDGMNLVAMYSRSESAHDTLCVTFRHRDVLKHKKYAQINARSGPYQLVPYKREIDYDLSQSLVMFGLSPCSEVTILDAESLGTSAILQGVEVQRFGDIVYIHLQKMDNDILLLIGTVEVLLRSDGNHRIVVMSSDGAVTADISTEIGGVKSRTIVSPKAKEPQVHEVNFVVDPEPSVRAHH
uniref:Membrane protein, putative n=1 Tax=Babesia bovis TaxID=5865 RepID=S6B3F5_BABBO|nr:membrane protein, putative [Babesia bovis]